MAQGNVATLAVKGWLPTTATIRVPGLEPGVEGGPGFPPTHHYRNISWKGKSGPCQDRRLNRDCGSSLTNLLAAYDEKGSVDCNPGPRERRATWRVTVSH